MRVGIDITPAVGEPHTGVGRYTQRLTEHLVPLGREHEYCLLHTLKGKVRNAFYEELAGDNVSVRAFSRFRRGTRLLWLMSHKLRFGVDSSLGALDLFHATCTCGPRVTTMPLVTTVHDTAFFTLPDTAPTLNGLYLSNTIRASLKGSALIIAASQSTKKDLMRLFGVPEGKVRVVYLAADGRFCQSPATGDSLVVRRKYGLTAPIILFVGTIQPRKNLVSLITAYHSLLREHDIDHSLVIVGQTGWSSESVFRMVRELGIDRRVVFAGEVPDEDLPAFYRAADLFVLPSLYEGFGLPAVEAMACGTPTIVSNVSSLPEIVGDAALKVAPTDSAELAKAVRAVLKDESLRRELTAKGLQRAKRFSWRRTAEETLEVYEEAAGLHRVRARTSPGIVGVQA